MNCITHTSKAAVGQCEKCGAPICEKCVWYSERLKNNNQKGCCECNAEIAQFSLDVLNSDRKFFLIGIIFTAVCLLIAVVLYFMGYEVATVIAVGIGGIPSAWKLLSRINIILRIILCFYVGIFAAPVMLIVNLIKLPMAYKEIERKADYYSEKFIGQSFSF